MVHASLQESLPSTIGSRLTAVRNPKVFGFYHGATRGMPTTGASGCVIVPLRHTDSASTIMSADSIWIPSPSCSTNIAALVALYHFLRAATEKGAKGINVVNDSAYVIECLSLRRPPKAARLQSWYYRCRRMADTLRVRSWTRTHSTWNASSIVLPREAQKTHFSSSTEEQSYGPKQHSCTRNWS
ncbi:hypothetical protein PHMEG_00010934 [Phytophthora megakarya]|uniref:RNase H type-1 domain-containing protein n=1 Tax=Phytophthora megakarya TaxID=4795 RepID=A0A225WCG8_9STRA|nr:hypothetical protein PHMEG_00010934 [Phytophthora megakarya]